VFDVVGRGIGKRVAARDLNERTEREVTSIRVSPGEDGPAIRKVCGEPELTQIIEPLRGKRPFSRSARGS
jgi:hypothetical protein